MFNIPRLKVMVETALKDNWQYYNERGNASISVRDSDIALTILIWQRYFGVEKSIGLDRLFDLPREDGIKRVRAHFQNDQKLYLPTKWSVAKKRGIAEAEWRAAMSLPKGEIGRQAMATRAELDKDFEQAKLLDIEPKRRYL